MAALGKCDFLFRSPGNVATIAIGSICHDRERPNFKVGRRHLANFRGHPSFEMFPPCVRVSVPDCCQMIAVEGQCGRSHNEFFCFSFVCHISVNLSQRKQVGQWHITFTYLVVSLFGMDWRMETVISLCAAQVNSNFWHLFEICHGF